MDNFITSIQSDTTTAYSQQTKPRIIPREMQMEVSAVVDVGRNTKVSDKQAMSMVYERAMTKLKSVVDDAYAQLGISQEDAATLDTSAEATANRIADFALGFFDKWAENHPEIAQDDAKKEFAAFIGSAIDQGISEASGILNSLNALSSDVESKITSISDLVRQRLDDFVSNT